MIMQTLTNGFNCAIAAALPTPEGVVFYRSSTHTWQGDESITRSFPDWLIARKFNTERTDAQSALGIPEDSRQVTWEEFSSLLGESNVDRLRQRAEAIRAELAIIEGAIAGIDARQEMAA